MLAYLGLAFLSTPTHAQDDNSAAITVPISYFHDLITVSVFVNDTGPYPFIIDTGSTVTVLYEGFSTQLEILQNGTATNSVHGINATEIRPELTATHFRIGHLNLGTVLPVAARPWTGENNLAGIIGTDLLQNYGLIINNGDKNITFATPDVFETLLAPSWQSVKLKSNPYDRKHPRGLLFVRVNIDADSRVPAIFDTGSQVTLMNRPTANDFFKGHRISNGRRKWTHRGALTTKYVNKFVRIPKLKIGRTEWVKAEVLVKNMTSLDIINKRRHPLMIIGMDLMKDRDFAINFPKKRLYVSGHHDDKAEKFTSYSLAFNEAGNR